MAEESICDTSISDAETTQKSKKRQRSLNDFIISEKSGKTNSNNTVSSSSDIKSRSKRSIVWNFFKKSADNKYVICQIKGCNAQVVWSGNTSNCRNHLARRHPKVLLSAETKTCVVSSTSSEDGDTTSEMKKINTTQMSMRKYVKKQKESYPSSSVRKIELDQKLTKMIIRDLQPMSIVDDIGFNEFVHTLEPRYSLPCRRRLRDILIENAYQNTLKNLKDILNKAKYVGITFDGWTSCTTQHYLTITCHFIQNSELKVATLAVSPVDSRSTSQNLSKIISDVFQNYPNLLVVAAVTDNARNVVAACKELRMTHIPCCAHTIQLVVNHVLDNTKSGSDSENNDAENFVHLVVKKCKDIATFFHHSSIATKALEKDLIKRNLPVLKLIQSVPTRWNSTFDMLERVHKNSEAIVYVLLTVENNVQQLTLSEKKLIPYILKCLKPFKDATIQLSGELFPTLSLIIPCTKHIMQELDDLYESIADIPEILRLHNELKALCVEYLLPYEERRFSAGFCTILDPRFKEHGFFLGANYSNVAQKLKNLLKEEIISTRPNVQDVAQNKTKKDANHVFNFLNKLPIQSKSSNSFAQAIVHFNTYLEEPILPMDTDVIAFWKNYKGCEELKALALKFFVLPATSVPSERVNSTAGNIISEKRSRLSPIFAEKLIFLRENFDNLKL